MTEIKNSALQEQKTGVNQDLENLVPDCRRIEQWSDINYLIDPNSTIYSNRVKGKLEEDAFVLKCREKNQDGSFKIVWRMLFPAKVRSDKGEFYTIDTGKSIETYAQIEKITKKQKPELISELKKYSEKITKKELPRLAASLRRVG